MKWTVNSMKKINFVCGSQNYFFITIAVELKKYKCPQKQCN